MNQNSSKSNSNVKYDNYNKSNQANANKGTNGTNKQFDKMNGNRGKQMNPNQIKKD